MTRWKQERRRGPRPTVFASLWLVALALGSVGASCGSTVVLTETDRCPPGWPEVREEMDELVATGEAPQLRLYLSLLLEHCEDHQLQLHD